MLDSLACALVKFLSGLLCLLPPGVAVRLGEAAGTVASWFGGKRTRIGIRNVHAAFDGQLSPSEARRIIRGCYRHLGAGFVEMLRLPAIDQAYIDRYLTIEGQSHFDQACASGKPVILLTAHYGNWELSSIVAALRGFPIVALARAQEKFPKLYRLLVSYRESKGCTIVHKGAVKRFITALEQRQLVGIVGDQASRQGILVDFFGRPALFATGPFEMALIRDAVILPVFIRRLRGPYHQIMVEPPIALSRQQPKDDAIRAGIERFADALSHRILDDPSQWLWMHKRWKHTPARRALVLSDGKLGHVKQSLTVVEALRQHHPDLTHHVVEIRYRGALGRMLALAWSWLMPFRAGAAGCLRAALSAESSQALLSRYADVVISCGSATVPANVLASAEQGAKSIVLMDPAPLPLSRFDLVIAPRHDALPKRPNVIETIGALSRPLAEEGRGQAQISLQAHPLFRSEPGRDRHQPSVSLFLGGDTAHYEVTASFAEQLISQVWAACEAIDGRYLVTTSRRTGEEVERLISRRVERDARCRLLLLASRDPLNGTMEGMLASADVAVVTGESVSMVTEACGSGRPVIVVEAPQRPGASRTTKHGRFLQVLREEGYITLAQVSEIEAAIRRAVAAPSAAKRLDNFEPLRRATAKLL